MSQLLVCYLAQRHPRKYLDVVRLVLKQPYLFVLTRGGQLLRALFFADVILLAAFSIHASGVPLALSGKVQACIEHHVTTNPFVTSHGD